MLKSREPSFRTFALRGVVALIVAFTVKFLGLMAWVPFLNELIRRPGAGGTVATLILGVTFWAFVDAYAVVSHVRGDGGNVRKSRREALLSAQRTGGETAKLVLSGQSSLDAARSEASYGPVRALVWALPALGFLGTAAEMGQAVDGLGAAVQVTEDYSRLRDALAGQVIPRLGDAFDITLFALGSSVVCYVLLALVNAREQRMLIEVDAEMLEVLAERGLDDRNRVARSRAELDLFLSSIDNLTAQVTKSRNALLVEQRRLAELNGSNSHVETLMGQMQGHLETIVQALGHDWVVRQRGDDFVARRGGSPNDRSALVRFIEGLRR